MKVAVIGNGNVGMAVFRELRKLREIRELVLIGRNQEKLAAEIEDLRDTEALYLGPTAELSFGGYDAAGDADIIIYAAGVGQKPGQSRLELTEENVGITKDIFEKVKKVSKDPVIIAISNPVDIITKTIYDVMDLPRTRVLGTGTLLDTARLKRFISGLTDVSPASIHVFVLGEHGDSSCAIWSSVRILGMTLDEYMSMDIGIETKLKHSILTDDVRATAGRIINAKGYTAYGVAAAAARVVSAVINDTHEIFPLTLTLEGEYGVNDLAISVPCMVGSEGVLSIKNMRLTDDERKAFEHSVDVIRSFSK